MAGPASYTENVTTRLAALERLVDRLLYASQAREPFTRLVAGQLMVGNSAPGRRILLNPDGADASAAEIWLLPGGVSESNPAKITVEESGTYPGEAVLTITSGQSSDALARFRQASGEIFMQVLDEFGSSDNGGYAYWGKSQAIFGFRDGSSNNYFNFSASGVSRHTGQWDDFGDQATDAGLLWGSVTSGSGNFHTITYPGFGMASNMGPIFGLRPGNAVPNFYWCITSSNTSGVTVEWSGSAQSCALYMCSFRH